MIKRKKQHWLSNTRIYRIWAKMKNRCNVESEDSYKYYWWRWITYDKKWEKFEWFYEDMKDWYDINLSLDRIKNDKDYSKKNCRWVTMKEQQNNRSNNRIIEINWISKTLSEWCDEVNLPYDRVIARINKYNWDIKKALWMI